MGPVRPRPVPSAAALPAAVLVLSVTSLVVSVAAVVALGFRLWFPATAVVATLIGLGVGVMVVQRLQVPRLGASTAVILMIVSCAFAIWVWLTRSENLIVNRDAASYLQTAIAFAQQHGTPLDPTMGSFGRVLSLDPERITLSSLAFYQVDWPLHPGIQPQFLPGATGLYTIGYWAGGVPGALWVAAIFGALSVLAVGVMAANWFGGPYGVMAAIATSLSFPLLYTSRTTFSEPIALFLTVCGALALGESVRRSGEAIQARRWGVLSVVFLVGNMLVRIDALREVLILYVVLYVLWRSGHSAARSMLRAVDIGLLACLILWLAESWIYLVINRSSVMPLLFFVVVARVALIILMTHRVARIDFGSTILRKLPKTLAAVTGIIWLFISSRPLWMVSRYASPSDQIAALQRHQGLAVDGTRNYIEQSLVWVSWWVGWLAVAACILASVVIVHRLTQILIRRQPLPPWGAPFVIGLVSTWLILWRPAIAPDHPWADRRLVPVVVFVIVTCVGAISWCVQRLGGRVNDKVRLLGSIVLAAALVVPIGMGSWPQLTERYGVGQAGGVQKTCDELQGVDAVVVLDPAGQVWTQVLRGVCGKPSIRVVSGEYASTAEQATALQEIDQIARDSGFSVAFVSSSADQLRELIGATGSISHVSFSPVMVEPSMLTTPPVGLAESAFTDLWWARMN